LSNGWANTAIENFDYIDFIRLADIPVLPEATAIEAPPKRRFSSAVPAVHFTPKTVTPARLDPAGHGAWV
jgi:hypothetical protein